MRFYFRRVCFVGLYAVALSRRDRLAHDVPEFQIDSFP